MLPRRQGHRQNCVACPPRPEQQRLGLGRRPVLPPDWLRAAGLGEGAFTLGCFSSFPRTPSEHPRREGGAASLQRLHGSHHGVAALRRGSHQRELGADGCSLRPVSNSGLPPLIPTARVGEGAEHGPEVSSQLGGWGTEEAAGQGTECSGLYSCIYWRRPGPAAYS